MAQEIVTNLVGKVVDQLFGFAKQEIGYMSNCPKNVDDLKKENVNLTNMKDGVVQQIKDAKDNGDSLKGGVEKWVVDAESHISEAKEVIDGYEANANKTCLTNLGTRHSYGKKAAKMAPSLIKVQEGRKIFGDCVSVPTPAPRVLDVYERHNIDDLETHKLCFKKIIESIKDDNIQIIGIYGTGGVGKTTLAKEVAVEVKSLNLFAHVEFITVSQPVGAKRIKNEAETAAKRINNGEKILVILDDLWGELMLDEVGIPCGDRYKNCKILLTSRSKDVCKTMKATGLINVDSLKKEEALTLFKRVVWDTVEPDEKLEEIAKKIVEGCGGLPLIIQAVGAALKNESIESWKRALTQLQKRTTSYIDPNIRLAYSHLQLSYDFLESEEAKLCFLLCSMFPEDFNISLECLAHYGVGLEIFEDLDSMEDARNRVRHAVKILKSTCLLLDGKYESTIKLHDVVREVALLIASKGNNKFLVKAGIGLTEWQPRTKRVKSCTGISLMYNNISELPDYELEITLLNIFLIQGNDLSTIPDEFILGVKETRVLDFEVNKIVSLPRSLQQLTKLCMLNLSWNKSLRDISILGDLKSVEILILSHTGIVEIPQEIGDLVNLRRLEVKGCNNLSHIAPNVISKLRWLEELHIAYYPVEDGNNDGFMEIGKLSMLTFLDLFVPHIHLIPTEGVCFTKLKGFVIQIGGYTQVYDDAEVVHKKTLILKMEDLDKSSSMSKVKELIKLSDGIIFESVVNPNIVPATICCESLDDLTTIMLSKCRNLSSLVEYSSNSDVDEEELGGGVNRHPSSLLEYSSNSDVDEEELGGGVNRHLSSLVEYSSNSDVDEEELGGGVNRNLSSLVESSSNLDVDAEELGGGVNRNLSSLVESSSNSDVDENTKEQFFSKLEHLFLVDLYMLHVLWDCRLDQYISLKNLVTLNIAYCNKLERLFSVNVAHGLVNLQTLTIQVCWSLKEVICDGDEGGIDMVVFHCLAKLELLSLPNLKSFYAGKVIISCPSLVKVNVKGCDRMEPYDKPDLELVNQTHLPYACRFFANWKVELNSESGNSFGFSSFNPFHVYGDQVKEVVGYRKWST